jgi:hypothetical protein
VILVGRISLVAIASCVACGEQDTTRAIGTVDVEASEPTPTFHQDVAPIFDAKCTGCHQEGGIAPFALSAYEPARARAAQIAAYTAERIMPPFLIETGGACGSFDEGAALTDAEIATIGRWVETGAARGVPVGPSPRPVLALDAGTDVRLPSFAPVIAGGALAEYDEYRCFRVEPGLAADQFVTGYEVLPGSAPIVHHVIAYIVDPSRVAGERTNGEVMQALDDESPDRLGWPCFGMAGAGVEIESAPVMWAPGQGVVEYPGGVGISLAKDRVLVAQVHYNLADPASRGAVDQTTVRLRLVDRVERQGIFLRWDELLNSLGQVPLMLPPGQASTLFQWSRSGADLGVPAGVPGELLALIPHMHGRGNKYTFEVATGGDYACQGRVNRWDVNWQRVYDYAEPVPFTADTQVRVTCDYDTRGDTTPVAPGWGTRNEMCFAALLVGLPPGTFL